MRAGTAGFGIFDYAIDGTLPNYAPNIGDNFRLAAAYMDRTLKVRTPRRLPSNSPTGSSGC